MRLSAIKISGFKSFAQPIELKFPQNTTGVVGPNGCGKSNVIDAIQWVLGASAGADLRSDSAQNVIFDGSENQTRAGRASVEMRFEGVLTSLGSKYGQQKNIKVRRVLERDKESRFSINNVSCRRKDIVSLFSGMGLTGKADYAIVTQGSVHNIAQSKPERIRLLIEEAADISGYLQKRKETLSRIKITRVNLQQANLTQKESKRRMYELQKQAEEAKKVLELRKRQKELRDELAVAMYEDLVEKQESKNLEQADMLKKLNTEKEETAVLLSEEQQLAIKLADVSRAQDQLQEEFNQILRAVGNSESKRDIMEERKKEHAEELDQLRRRHMREHNRLETCEADLQLAQAEYEKAQGSQDTIPGEAQQKKEQEEFFLLQKTLDKQHGEAMRSWEKATEKTLQNDSKYESKKSEIERMRKRLEQLQRDVQAAADASALKEKEEDFVYALRTKRAALQKDMEKDQREKNALEKEQEKTMLRQREHEEQYRELEQKLTRITSILNELTSSTREDTATKSLPAALKASSGELRVKPGWERAFDLVAHHLIKAHTTGGMTDALKVLTKHKDISVALMSDEIKTNEDTLSGKKSAAQYIDKGPVPSFLCSIYPCDTLEEAIELRESLKEHQSLITPQGDWLGKNWAILGGGGKQGELVRSKRIKDLTHEQEKLKKEADKTQEKYNQVKNANDMLAKSLSHIRQKIYDATAAISKSGDELMRAHEQENARRERQQRAEYAQEQKQEEMKTIQLSLKTSETQFNDIQRQKEQADAEKDTLAEKKEHILQEREEARRRYYARVEEVKKIREQVTDLQDKMLLLQKTKNDLCNNIESIQTQIAKQKTKSAEDFQKSDIVRSQVERINKQRQQVEEKLKQKRKEHQTIDDSIQTVRNRVARLETNIAVIERDLQESQKAKEQLELELTDIVARTDKPVLKARKYKTQLSIPELRTQKRQLEAQLDRLGEVNQLAVEDYEAEKKRHEEVETQAEQIKIALTNLEKAIDKIDRESRKRFDETFKKVNAYFGELFANISDGGKAHLVEEKYEEKNAVPGIRIMASPRGRRHSIISLLSGGEKTLVALSLIMAIFRLNPAPFCLMDEADAMLDDGNVMQFNKMIRDMSKDTQFIVITHNKITMEFLRHLIGITMSEPGISRAVSVDLEKAVAMAGESQE